MMMAEEEREGVRGHILEVLIEGVDHFKVLDLTVVGTKTTIGMTCREASGTIKANGTKVYNLQIITQTNLALGISSIDRRMKKLQNSKQKKQKRDK